MGKSTYRTDNRKEYNQSLINRDSLTFWIDEEAISGWLCSEHHGNRGRGYQYSDTALMVKRLFNLSLRAVQGFMNSVFSLMKVPLTCPNYSSISERKQPISLSKCLLEVKFVI